MKTIKMLLLFVFCVCSIHSQVQQEWFKRYNGNGNSIDLGKGIAISTDNEIYALGSTEINVGGNKDFVVIKFNSLGHILWSDQFNGTGNSLDEPIAMVCDNSGDIYVTGNSIGINTGIDIVLIKYKPNGTREWVKRYSGSGSVSDEVKAIIIDASNNIILTGLSNDKVVLIKYNPAGNIIWAKNYDNYPGYGHSVDLDNSGNIFVAGHCRRNFENYDFIALKYDNSGNLLWARIYGSNHTETAKFISVDLNQNVYISGPCDSVDGRRITTIKYDYSGNVIWQKSIMMAAGYVTDLYGFKLNESSYPVLTLFRNESYNSYFITTVKYDTSGNEMWRVSYPGVPQALILDNHNSYITGWDYIIGEPSGAIVIKYDDNGNMIWNKKFQETSYSTGHSMAMDYSNNLYMVGQCVFSSSNDLLIVKYSNTIGINPISTEIPERLSLSQNYPNPFNPTTKFRFALPKNFFATLVVYDALGRKLETLVNEQLNAGIYEADWNASKFSSGVYFYKLQAGNFSETKRMVLVK